MEGRIALKEWAAAVDALMQGDQILILRKGGISEETVDFELESDTFILYPTFEHQKKHLIKERYQPLLETSLLKWDSQASQIIINCFAKATADIEIFDERQLEKLHSYHIWTEQFASERLKWKRAKPLHAIILRVYKLDKPVMFNIEEEYNGCKSWIHLRQTVDYQSAEPVMSDEKFDKVSNEIKFVSAKQ